MRTAIGLVPRWRKKKDNLCRDCVWRVVDQDKDVRAQEQMATLFFRCALYVGKKTKEKTADIPGPMGVIHA